MYIPDAAIPAITINIIVTATAILVVALRMYTRAALVKNLGVDDYTIVASMLGSIAFLAVIFLQIKKGLGRQVEFDELPGFLMALWATIPLYNVALILCKISIAFQYYRVFRTPSIQFVLKCILICLTLYGSWAVLGTIFTCYPVQKYWDFTIQDGQCLSRNAITFANAGINIATDLVLLALPLPLLNGLQISLKQRIILLGVFACGGFACAMSIVRLKSLMEIGAAPPNRQSVDGVNIAIWSCIEINVGIICASVPALKALVVRLAPKLVLSNIYHRSRHPYSRYGQQRDGRECGDDGEKRMNWDSTPTAGSSSRGKGGTIIELDDLTKRDGAAAVVDNDSQEQLVLEQSWRGGDRNEDARIAVGAAC